MPRPSDDPWPPLPLAEWQDTYATLHLWTQVVGKVRMALSPPLNHFWHVTLYVCARGLTTSAIPFSGGIFEIRFDFIDHALLVETSDGTTRRLPLAPRSVADFYGDLFGLLASLDIHPKIAAHPDEVPNPIPFAEDRVHASYDPEYARRFWRILVSADSVFQEFRGRFIAKSSPVHFFWGACDLAVTRFSGRRAPPRPGADAVQSEAYSHEVSSVGFWPGGGGVDGPAFYSYAAPEPAGFRERKILPGAAFYHSTLGEFILMYDDARRASSPRESILDFAQSAYDAAADLGRWDREACERQRTP
ncbi:MAG TPA: DUF5996 family protein [Candidatus Acidoferrales bacterium]|nr:DUF5996 family protein [Candidatus Acidoferrales bacterium]